MIRAGAADQKPAGTQKLHRPEVDLIVTPDRILDLFPALHEGRRVENNAVIRSPLYFVRRQKIEDVDRFEAAAGFQMVSERIAAGPIKRPFRLIDPSHLLRAE